MTKISISISQIFCSWVAIYQLRPPMTSLSCSLYDMLGLAPRMNFFILRATRLSNKLLEKGYVKERLKSSMKKFYGRYGDIIKQYEVPLSRMLNDILIKYNDNLPSIRLYTKSVIFVPNSTFYRLMRSFHRKFTTGVLCWQGTLTHPDTWSRPIWDMHMFYLLRPILFPELVVFFPGLFTSNISRYFLDFARI